MKVTRVLTMQRAESGPAEVTRDNHLDFGAAELEGFPNLQLGVALQARGGACGAAALVCVG